MEVKNILFITSEYDHETLPSSGGIGVFYAQYAKQLVKNGYLVHLLGKGKNKSFNDEGVNINFIPTSTVKLGKVYIFIEKILHKLNLSHLLFYFLKKDRVELARYASKLDQKYNFDIVESPEYLGEAAFLSKLPLVTRMHGSYHMLYRYAGVRENYAFKKLEKIQFKNSKGVIANSSFSYEFAQNHFSRKPDVTIYNPISKNILEVQKVNKNPKSIIYFGTLSDQKGVPSVLRIFNELVKRDSQWQLTLIGKGHNYYNTCLKQVSVEAIKNISYIPHVAQSVLYEKVAEAQVALLPSHIESFGMVFLESILLGTTPVVRDIPIVHELILDGKTGFICKSENEMIEKIEYIQNTNFSISEEVIDDYKKRFSIDSVVDVSIKTYTNILKDRQI